MLKLCFADLALEGPFQVPQWGDPCGSPAHPPSDPQGRSMFTVSGPSNKINVSNHPGISCSDKDSSTFLAQKVKHCTEASKQDTICAELSFSCRSALGMFCCEEAL